MSIEYSYRSSCCPMKESREIEIGPEHDLTVGSAYDQLIEVLREDGVAIDRILALKYRFNKTDEWKRVRNEPIKMNKNSGKIFIEIILKPCGGQMERELEERVSMLEKSNRDLDLCVKSLQAQLERLQKEMKGMSQPPQPDIPSLPDLLPTVDLVSRPVSVSALRSSRALQSYAKEVDISYLYAVPLVRLEKRAGKEEPLPLTNPIDAYKEIETIHKELLSSKKEIQLTLNTGSLTTLNHALEQKPKILHISCHGGYELESGSGERKLYLYLESNKLPGVMDKYDVKTLKERFTPEKGANHEVRPRLVFISACYSQPFGEIIRDAGVPNVIAVNGYTQVADEAATGFASSFYHSLFQGKTVKEAFIKAKEQEKLNNRNIRLCCCAHRHEDDCPWLERMSADAETVHATHVPECNCKYGGNLHHMSCSWIKELRNHDLEFRIVDYDDPVTHKPTNLRKVCCCNPNLPHSEEEKFMLLSRDEEAANERIFDCLPSGEPTVTKCFEDDMVPRPEETMIGRNIEIQKLVNLLTCKQIICVTGPPNCGKSLLIRTAARYVMERGGTPGCERGYFADGFETIRLTNTLWLLSKLNAALLPPDVEARDMYELQNKIRRYRKLVVLECESVMETNAEDLVKQLREILRGGTGVKFILTAQKRVPELQVDGEVVLREDLSPLSAYNIIKSKNPAWTMSYLEYLKSPLADKLKTPWLIKKAAMLLKESSADDVFKRLCDNKEISNDNFEKGDDANYKNLIANTLNGMRDKCGDLSPLLLLAQLHAGASENTFIELSKDCGMDYKKMLDEYINENKATEMVTRQRVDELDEFRYKISEDMCNYINTTYLDAKRKAICQCQCIQVMAVLSRQLVRTSPSFSTIRHDEFSAILDDGIWKSCGAELETAGGKEAGYKNANLKFQYEKENITSLLDPRTLLGIVKETDPLAHKALLSNIHELTLCTFSLLYFERRNEAVQIADVVQGFVHTAKAAAAHDSPVTCVHEDIRKKYKEIEATMMLLKAIMALQRSGLLEADEAMKRIEEAERLFGETKNDAGTGEAIYIHALFLSKHKDNYNNAKMAYDAAIDSFKRAGCKLGVARASIAEAILMIENEKPTGVPELLDSALAITQGQKHMEGMMAECFYHRGLFKEQQKQYEAAKVDLQRAQDIFYTIEDKHWEIQCNSRLQRIADLMQQDCPLFAFLKAFPLVKAPSAQNVGVIPLEPNVRKPSFFRPMLNDCFKLTRKAIKVYFDTLSLSTLQNVLSKSCAVLHLSSDYYTKGTMGLEGELGNLEQIPLAELQKILEPVISTCQCKVVVVAIPESKDIAQMFVKLGVPHVVYFDFSAGDFQDYEHQVDIRSIKYESIYQFCISFYKGLLENRRVSLAWENAKNVMIEYVKGKGDEFKLSDRFHYGVDPGPVMLPEVPEGTLPEDDPIHYVDILPNLKVGEYMTTSPERGRCDIEKDRRPFVGRQEELYRVAFQLKERKCVNLYGEYGVGKTRFAREIGYFMYMRIIFKSEICFIEFYGKSQSYKSFQSAKQYLRNSDNHLPILIIIDNLDRSTWQKERHYFMSLRNDRDCVFLFISRDPLESPQGKALSSSTEEEAMDFPIFRYELKRFENQEISLDYVFSELECKGCPLTPEQLGVESQNRKAIRNAVAVTVGFKQANGYPKLLSTFCDKIAESHDISSINLLEDRGMETRYRKLIIHAERNSIIDLAKAQSLAPIHESIRKQSVQFEAEEPFFEGLNKVTREVRGSGYGQFNTTAEAKLQPVVPEPTRSLMARPKPRVDDSGSLKGFSLDNSAVEAEANNDNVNIVADEHTFTYKAKTGDEEMNIKLTDEVITDNIPTEEPCAHNPSQELSNTVSNGNENEESKSDVSDEDSDESAEFKPMKAREEAETKRKEEEEIAQGFADLRLDRFSMEGSLGTRIGPRLPQEGKSLMFASLAKSEYEASPMEESKVVRRPNPPAKRQGKETAKRRKCTGPKEEKKLGDKSVCAKGKSKGKGSKVTGKAARRFKEKTNNKYYRFKDKTRKEGKEEGETRARKPEDDDEKKEEDKAGENANFTNGSSNISSESGDEHEGN